MTNDEAPDDRMVPIIPGYDRRHDVSFLPLLEKHFPSKYDSGHRKYEMTQNIREKMRDNTPKFTKEQLVRHLSCLNEELKTMGTTGELCIVGGAAMLLAFGSRESTRDIDALLMSPPAIRAAAQRVAERQGIPASWLNDGARGFASGGEIESKELLNMSHLRVVSPPPEYILAMKCVAARIGIDEHDKEDAKFLVKHLGVQSKQAVLGIVAQYYDAKRIPAKTQYFVEEILNELDSTEDNC